MSTTPAAPSAGNPPMGPNPPGSRLRRVHRPKREAAPVRPTGWKGYLLLILITLAAFFPIFGSDTVWTPYETTPRSPFTSMSEWTGAWTIESIRENDPLTLTSYFLERHSPLPIGLTHHALNLLLHLFAAVLLLKIAEALHLHGALAAALIFALHPMVIPAVFWSGYRDLLLATVLALAALLCGIRNRYKLDFLLMLILSGLGFLAHPGTLALPVVLALVIYFQKRHSALPDYNRVLPVACLALVFAVWLQPGRELAAMAAENQLLANGSRNLAFFVEHGLLPEDPALFHPISRNEGYSAGASSDFLPFAFFLPFYVLFGFNFRKHWARGMFVGVSAFLLFSLSGIFHPGSFIDGQPAKEPATAYLALPFMLALVVCGSAAFFALGGRSGLRVWQLACGLLVAAQLVVAHSFNSRLSDPSTLWRTMADQWPDAWEPRLAYLDSSRTEEGFRISDEAAINLLQSIIAQQPERHDLKYELLAMYLKKDQFTNALNEYRRILRDTQPPAEFLREAADFFDRMNLGWEADNARNRIDRLPSTSETER